MRIPYILYLNSGITFIILIHIIYGHDFSTDYKKFKLKKI